LPAFGVDPVESITGHLSRRMLEYYRTHGTEGGTRAGRIGQGGIDQDGKMTVEPHVGMSAGWHTAGLGTHPA
jgi:hypothetical protein